MTAPMLEVLDVTAGYGGGPVLHDVTITVEPATITAVLGANGAGKTTLLRTISGLVKRTAGRGARSTAPTSRRCRSSSWSSAAWRTCPRGVASSASSPSRRTCASAACGRTRRTTTIYDLFPPLASRRSHLGDELSGGERQMLALGRALVSGPKLLLLDEPSLGLAPRVVAQIMALLARLRDERGLTVLLVEQNVRSALSVADRGVVMALGRVVTEAPARALRDDQDLRHAYLGF